MALKVDDLSEFVHGDVERRFDPVADALAANFAERGGIGAAVTVYRDGEKVVDCRAGKPRPRMPTRSKRVLVNGQRAVFAACG